MRTPFRIRFNATDEFTKELGDRAPNIEPIVRATMLFRPSAITPNVQLVYVLATYIREVGNDLIEHVELERFCGEQWPEGMGGKGTTAEEYAQNNLKIIRTFCEPLNIEVRAGTYEPIIHDLRP